MRLPRECYQMQQIIETHLPHLSQPQLTGLAWWVCGAILVGPHLWYNPFPTFLGVIALARPHLWLTGLASLGKWVCGA